MCRPPQSGGRALHAAPPFILRSGLHTCFSCRSYPLLLRVTGSGISREPHWIAPERNEPRAYNPDIRVSSLLDRERGCRRWIAPALHKELARRCDLMWAPMLTVAGGSAGYPQRGGIAGVRLRVRARRVRRRAHDSD